MKKKTEVKNQVQKTKVSKPISHSDLYLYAGIIVLITFITLSPLLKAAFINWDDNAYVFENPHLAKPIPKAIAYFFGPHYFVGNYIPLTMVTFVLEYHFVALKPGLYHLVNIIFHVLNVFLVFRFIYLLSDKKPIVAALVAILFGIHPMHVESVAWVSELKDVQYTFFFLLALIYYYKYIKQQENPLVDKADTSQRKIFLKPLVFTFVLFLLSLLSKPAAVSFPLVLLLLDYYNKRKFDKWLWLEKIPFFLLSLIFGFIAIKSQQADSLLHNNYPIYERVFFASHSFLDYIVKLFLPINLSIFYPYPRLKDGHLPIQYYLAPILVTILFYGAYRIQKYSRLIVFGLLFFTANIIFVLQLLSVGDAIKADRYTYVSYLGLFFVIGMGVDHLYNSNRVRFRINKTLIAVLTVAILICFCVISYYRTKVWKNETLIANDLLQKFPNDYLALNNKGFILFDRREYQEAAMLFTQAIQAKPNYVRASINLTDTYLALNDYDNAIKIVNQALTHNPLDHYLLKKKGSMIFAKGNYLEAAEYFSEAIRQKKNEMSTYIFLAETQYKMNNYEAGIKTIEDGLKIEPENYILLNNKGYFLFLEHKYEQAIEFYNASLKIQPDYRIAKENLLNCTKAMNSASRTNP